jgi:hypothetical protein
LLTLVGTTIIKGTTNGIPLANNGNLTFNGGTLAGSTFTNNGTVAIINGMALTSGASFTNQVRGTVTNNGGVIPSGFLGISSGTFTNEGVLNQDAGTLTLATDFQNIGGIVSWGG